MTNGNQGIGTKHLGLLALAVAIIGALGLVLLRGEEPALRPPF